MNFVDRLWWRSAEQDSLSEELEAGADEHLALYHLDPIDVPLNDAGAAGQGQPGDDRVPGPSMPLAKECRSGRTSM